MRRNLREKGGIRGKQGREGKRGEHPGGWGTIQSIPQHYESKRATVFAQGKGRRRR